MDAGSIAAQSRAGSGGRGTRGGRGGRGSRGGRGGRGRGRGRGGNPGRGQISLNMVATHSESAVVTEGDELSGRGIGRARGRVRVMGGARGLTTAGPSTISAMSAQAGKQPSYSFRVV